MSARDSRKNRDRFGNKKKKLSTGAWVGIAAAAIVVVIIIVVILYFTVLKKETYPDPAVCTAAPLPPVNPAIAVTEGTTTVHTITWEDPGGEEGYDAVLVNHWFNSGCAGAADDTTVVQRGETVATFTFPAGTSQGDHCYRLETRNPCGLSTRVPEDEPYITGTVE